MSEREMCPKEEMLALLQAEALEPDEKAALEAHVAGCAACRESLEASRSVGAALRALPLPEPSRAAKDRAYAAVLRAMEERAASQAPSRGGSGRAPTVQALARPAAPRAARSWGPRFAVAGVGLAAAACLLLLLGPLAPRTRTPEATQSVARADKVAVLRSPSAPTSATVSPSGPAEAGEPDRSLEAMKKEAASEWRALLEESNKAAAERRARANEAEALQAKSSSGTASAALRPGAADEKADAEEKKGLREAEDAEVARLSAVHEARECLLAARFEGTETGKVAGAPADASPGNGPAEAPTRRADQGGATPSRSTLSKNDDASKDTLGPAGSAGGTTPSDADARKAAPVDKPAPPAAPTPSVAAPGGADDGRRAMGGAAPATASRTAASRTLRWVVDSNALSCVQGRFFVEPLPEPSRKANAKAGVGPGVVGEPEGVAPVTSVSAVSSDDPFARRLALRALDREIASQPHDTAWAERVTALGDFLRLGELARPEIERSKAAAAEAAPAPTSKAAAK